MTSSTDLVALAPLRLKPNEDRRLRGGHLWAYSNEIDVAATPLTAFEPGQQVELCTSRGQSLGVATVNPNALICARLLERGASTRLGRRFLELRLRAALAWRERLHPDRRHRWVFGESDGLPGLVLDLFGNVVVGQISTWGMEHLRPEIEAAVQAVAGPITLVWKNDSGARELERLPEYVEAAGGGPVPAEVTIVERPRHAIRLSAAAPLARGQKTGWYYDQTDNRSRLARWLAGGERVLDVCSYVGAWSAISAACGARAVTLIDGSATALEYARRNLAPFADTESRFIEDDAFDALAALAEAGERFEVVVVDPPAFIKRRKEFGAGQAAYRKLNQLALRLVETGGMLVSCSCSWHFPESELVAVVQAAARHVDRFVQIVETGGQSSDHPIHPAIAETRYLKALFCRVSRE